MTCVNATATPPPASRGRSIRRRHVLAPMWRSDSTSDETAWFGCAESATGAALVDGLVTDAMVRAARDDMLRRFGFTPPHSGSGLPDVGRGVCPMTATATTSTGHAAGITGHSAPPTRCATDRAAARLTVGLVAISPGQAEPARAARYCRPGLSLAATRHLERILLNVDRGPFTGTGASPPSR